MPKPGVAPPESTVTTACPLDCPDACTLTVTVRGGRVTKIDGSTENHITNGYICAKVRRFHERVYGEDRLLYPAVRRGAKGAGMFKRVTWDDALDLDRREMLDGARRRAARETILPLCYGGSNGLLTQDYADAILFRRFGTSRLLRTVCAAPTGAANLGLYGKMASVSYQDYPDAKLIIVWGVNPGVSGIHLMPYPQGGARQRRLHRRDRSARHRRWRGRPTCTSRCGPAPTSRSRSRSIAICSRKATPTRRSSTRTPPAPRSCARRRAPWTFERAAEVSGVERRSAAAAGRALREDARRRS